MAELPRPLWRSATKGSSTPSMPYYQPDKDLGEAELLEHRQQVTKERPSLPAVASKAAHPLPGRDSHPLAATSSCSDQVNPSTTSETLGTRRLSRRMALALDAPPSRHENGQPGRAPRPSTASRRGRGPRRPAECAGILPRRGSIFTLTRHPWSAHRSGEGSASLGGARRSAGARPRLALSSDRRTRSPLRTR
jgi:hypothetical protein